MLLIEAIKDGSLDGFIKILPPLFIHNEDGSYGQFMRSTMETKSLHVCPRVCGWLYSTLATPRMSKNA